MDIEITTAPTETATDVVSLESVKTHMRIVNTKRDPDLTQKIEAVYDRLARPADNMLNRTIVATTFKLYLPAFPTGNDDPADDCLIRLPYPPLRSVTSVEYMDASGVLQTLTTDDYVVSAGDQTYIGVVRRVASSWPATKTHPRAVQITFEAGYETIPPDFALLVKLMVAHYDANTEATINEPRQMAVNRKVEFAHDYLVDRLRVPASLVDGEYGG